MLLRGMFWSRVLRRFEGHGCRKADIIAIRPHRVELNVRLVDITGILVGLGILASMSASHARSPQSVLERAHAGVRGNTSSVPTWDLVLEAPQNTAGAYRAGDTIPFRLNRMGAPAGEAGQTASDSPLQLKPVGEESLQKAGFWLVQAPTLSQLNGAVVAGNAGELTLPAFDLTSADGAVLGRTLPQVIRVSPADPNDPENKPQQEVIPARDLPMPVWTLVTIVGLVGMVLVIAGYFLVRALVRYWRRRKALRSAAPALTPEAECLARLKELEASGMMIRGEWKQFAFALSEIFRQFLNEKFGIEALESTSEELLQLLRPLQSRTAWFTQVPEWLAGLDEVKFTESVPSAEVAVGWLERVRQWIHEESRRAI